MRKYVLFILVSLFLLPNLVSASWWNPFTWFKKKSITPTEQVFQIPRSLFTEEKEEVSVEQTKTTTVKNKPNSVTSKPRESKKVDTRVLFKPVLPIAIQSATSNILAISNINIESTSSSTYISWQTSIPAESKILLDGKVYFSKNNISTLHYVEIVLDGGKSYTGTITGLANNSWVNKEITFSTKQVPLPPPAPLQITIGNKNCTYNSCKIEWQTNYPTTSSITITKVGQENVSWTFDSENNSGTGHWKTINNLISNTQYIFNITSVFNSESVQTQGSFFTPKQDEPCTGVCA